MRCSFAGMSRGAARAQRLRLDDADTACACLLSRAPRIQSRAKENGMKMVLIALASVTLLSAFAAPETKKDGLSAELHQQVTRAWQDFKTKNKNDFAALLTDDFEEAEEDGAGFRDKKTELAEMDDYGLTEFAIRDFKVKPLAPNAALVTYRVAYKGASGGQPYDNRSVFGEVWVKRGGAWKVLHVQETKLK
jgi:hypothetical protein